ncbi:hypothetical protein Tco_0938564 [Tanacetum coccineum]|uniref:Uncharacterized protein n=1 Tax=Tanacetum coccineum TaxID=301880 RepID=A0ABQ5DNQ4_9ASTR
MANVSKSFSIPDDESPDDTPSVARKFLNEVKDTLVTLQRVVKHRMNGNIMILSSSTRQEIHKIFKDEIVPIVNQVGFRVQNFKNHFVKEAAKFVRDFKSLTKEVDDSLDKIKIHPISKLSLIVRKINLNLGLSKRKKNMLPFGMIGIKKCVECKYDKISYDISYNDMQHQIKRLQAQLGDLKGKSSNTQCASNTLDHLSQKLEDENVSLEFQVKSYAKENAHLKTTYKNLFDSINVTRAQTKGITDSLQNKLNDMIYENTKLRAQLFDKVSEQKNTTKGTRVNTQFSKLSILGNPSSSYSQPKLYYVTPFLKSMVSLKGDETNDLLKPVTLNSTPSTRESTIVKK